MQGASGLTYLAVAYGAFFVILAVYLDLLRRRNRDLWQALRDLESARSGPGEGL